MPKTYLFATIAALTFTLMFSLPANAKTHYSGSHHSSSHGGHYAGGHGSSHKGGHYKNAKTGNHYGCHKC